MARRTFGLSVFLGLLGLLVLLGNSWSVTAAPAKFDVRQHISSSTRFKRSLLSYGGVAAVNGFLDCYCC